MVVLMGGRNSQGYNMFQHLTVKAFIALRPYADQLINTARLMLDTGLPSFKGEGTIKRLRDRFVLGVSERHAADVMMGLVKNAHENMRSTAYDEFQRVSFGGNRVPYSCLTICSSFKTVHRVPICLFAWTHILMQVFHTSSDFRHLEVVVPPSVVSTGLSWSFSRVGIQHTLTVTSSRSLAMS